MDIRDFLPLLADGGRGQREARDREARRRTNATIMDNVLTGREPPPTVRHTSPSLPPSHRPDLSVVENSPARRAVPATASRDLQEAAFLGEQSLQIERQNENTARLPALHARGVTGAHLDTSRSTLATRRRQDALPSVFAVHNGVRAPVVVDAADRRRTQQEIADETAQITGASANYLRTLVGWESNDDPNANPGSSTAGGLGQFTDPTWLAMIHNYGGEHGEAGLASAVHQDRNGNWTVDDPEKRAEIMRLRDDPRWSWVMTGHYAQENAQIMRAALGRNVTEAEVYIGHFAGPVNGSELIRAAADERSGGQPRTGAEIVGREAAYANGNVFFDCSDGTCRWERKPDRRGDGTHLEYVSGGRPRTADEVVQRQEQNFRPDPWPVTQQQQRTQSTAVGAAP